MIRLKIINTNDFETIVQINNKKNIDTENIPQDCWAKVIFEIYAIWINNDGFGIYIRPILISLSPNTKTEYNYNLLEDSDDMDDIINTVNDNSIFIKSEPTEVDNSTSVLELPSNENDNYYKEMSEETPINSASSDNKIEHNSNISSTSSD